ncbi:MAG: TIGR04197 family type VII secretion effector [Roseburia sp.]|nr:TIGR04197 family type VII secretion effector [Roseburia sp.]MCM1242037.1 TIGR04197 family type VII secretion effector [Roseburia sp.]
MSDTFLSKGDVAEEHSRSIQSMRETFSQVFNVEGCRTNLTVIGKMLETVHEVTANNDAYKELLSKDATAITDVKTEYDEFDQKLSECMGIE